MKYKQNVSQLSESPKLGGLLNSTNQGENSNHHVESIEQDPEALAREKFENSLENFHRRLMGKQVESCIIRKRKAHSKETPPNVTPWDCWASSKAEYIKNKRRMEKRLVL